VVNARARRLPSTTEADHGDRGIVVTAESDATRSPSEEIVGRRLTTPRAAAVAGLLFSALFGTVLVLIRTVLPAETREVATSLVGTTGRLTLAVILMPFAGIAFLWFVGVVRDRLGELEDRFFASVMFGSALLFLAMLFAAMALVGGILAAATDGVDPVDLKIIVFGREVMFQITNVYALRMAGVFMISVATIWLRTGLMPRWLVVGTYVLALALLLVITLSLWVTLVFPSWVCLVSVLILKATFRTKRA
jgi:hypothetical protein